MGVLDFLFEGSAFFFVASTKHYRGAGIGKYPYTTLAYPFAATSDNGDFIVVTHTLILLDDPKTADTASIPLIASIDAPRPPVLG